MIKNIKKIMGFLCYLIFCTIMAIGMPQMARAAEVAIDETNFPDEIFRKYVNERFDWDKNEKLSEQEIANTTTISIEYKEVKSLIGIEYFTELTELDCRNNQLATLDVSKNTALTKLWCGFNQLATLDLSKNTALISLECSSNQLTTLDLSKNTALTELYCYYDQLTTLDLSKNTTLTELDCRNNQLATLNVNSPALTELRCYYNQLTTLDLSKNTALTELYCYSNQLTTLDVSKSTALISLDCSGNQLTTLDVSKSTALISLDCSGNQLATLDVSKNTALISLDCGFNQLTELDLGQNIALQELDCDENQLTELDLSQNIALQKLYCCSNQLTELDVNNNENLIILRCYANQLTKLNVNNTVLQELNCSGNQLTELDLSQNIALQELDCGGNQLQELDLSNNKNLQQLSCYSYLTDLTELKLHSQTYNALLLYRNRLHSSYDDFSDLQNVTITNNEIKVTDITKPATYKVNGRDFTIIYVDKEIIPSAAPSASPSATPSIEPSAVPSDAHIFSDYNYKNPVSDNKTVIYGNSKTQTVDSKKVNNKVFTAYTDILASYKYTLNSKGTVKPSVGKVVVAVTKSDIKPEVNSKNKITDTSASKIAKAKIKNGQITVTAVGKEGGLVYLWVIDTGSKGVSACCPINVKLAPTKLEVQNTSGSKIANNTKLENGKTFEVCVAGLVGSTKTEDGTYTAIVDSKYQSYVTVSPVEGSINKFTINAKGLKNNKDTKVTVTFKCDQNGKKTKLSLTITK